MVEEEVTELFAKLRLCDDSRKKCNGISFKFANWGGSKEIQQTKPTLDQVFIKRNKTRMVRYLQLPCKFVLFLVLISAVLLAGILIVSQVELTQLFLFVL